MHSPSSTCTHTPAIRHIPRRSSLLHTFHQLIALYRSRRALAALSDAELKDIGLTADAAQREARRPVWDVPDYWMR
ncbi:DUF1127 domain-containing protein [Sulfitobacter aestuariivivens]|uniref:DUF1127 domain-containing protein n=1 Tax=Sulfitobacter aestuariivivens TaxID=2766981 RepID=A0A927D087_9RHOB|nr:DUF1127 domain-containing protein [Sulfitobacter aestuariivivens]MBD3662660.1 DUF1127 domain-containing protein [Sulfitobacter aestuariivivens]